MKALIKKILRNFGYEIRSYSHLEPEINRRLKIMNYYSIDTLLDVGANIGQYAINMRSFGYKNKIISFEPIKSSFEVLKKNSLNDNNWIINNYGLGDKDTEEFINIAGNSVSSSLLNMLPKHFENAPTSKYIDKEKIELKKLDSIFNSFCNENNNIMLKIDTQGYEKNVLFGALESLKKIRIIQLEMSLVELYEGELLFMDMINYLKEKKFELYSLENGFESPLTGQMLQTDGIFVRV